MVWGGGRGGSSGLVTATPTSSAPVHGSSAHGWKTLAWSRVSIHGPREAGDSARCRVSEQDRACPEEVVPLRNVALE